MARRIETDFDERSQLVKLTDFLVPLIIVPLAVYFVYSEASKNTDAINRGLEPAYTINTLYEKLK